MNDLLLRACRREPVARPPVWIMRQAGRYLPEYRAVRARADFLTMVRTPELAAEVTLQPVNLLGVDAAIIFSDILVIPQAMGMALTVEDGEGPRFTAPLRSAGDIERLIEVVPEEHLHYVLDAIRLVRRDLAGRVPLIGFAGAPWTLACYMIEGGGGASRQFSTAKRSLIESPRSTEQLLDRLASAVSRFLVAQVEAGAQVVQIFESAAGALAPSDYRKYALPHLVRVVRIARDAGAPVVVFAPGAGWALETLASETGADVIGIDWQTDAADARRRLAPFPVAVQGNFDPSWLHAAPSVIREKTRQMLRDFQGPGHIANLGHGILPDTPVAHARAFIDAVRESADSAARP